jgi:hypothetical protein
VTPSPGQGDLLASVLEAETRVWQALLAGDAAADHALLAQGFLGVYPTGFAGRDDHAAQLAAGPSVAAYRIGEARGLDLSPGLFLLAYHVRFLRQGGTGWEAMYVSSLWQRQGGGWINLFSQDTPEGPALP